MSTNIDVNTITEIEPKTAVELSVDSATSVTGGKVGGQVEAYKKEYTITGDNIFISRTADSAPGWLVSMIGSTVDNAVNNGLTDYDSLVQDVRTAIDSIDIAKNTFVSTVNFSTDVNSIVGTRIDTLNTTLDNKFATIANLDTVVVNNDLALTQQVSDLRAEFNSSINSRITNVETAFANADSAIASDVQSLTTAFENQEGTLSGVSDAVTGVQTYVGLTGDGVPSGMGILSRLHTLEKQTDGVIDFLADTYDVMNNVAENDPDNTDDLFYTDALPYVLWTNIHGIGVPAITQRSYVDYKPATPVNGTVDIIENTLFVRSDFTDVNVDKYYKFTQGSWVAIDEAEFTLLDGSTKAAHVGDVYVMYEIDAATNTKNYIKSYKFIKTLPDTSAPYSTDTDGYTWALVTDTDTQKAYMIALEARDLADGKISQFFAYGSASNLPRPTYGTGEGKYQYWFNTTTNKLYNYISDNWSPMPIGLDANGGAYISEGDLCAVVDSNGDITYYTHNGDGTWSLVGPSGIISTSKYFVDLEAQVNGAGGLVEAQANLETSIVTYTDDAKAYAESKFEFNAPITIGGITYTAGFGLVNAATDTGDITNTVTGNNSEFWINANELVLKNPTHPGASATFEVNANGLNIRLDQTEATRNVFRGPWIPSITYKKGDIVTYNGNSYSALLDFTETTSFSVPNWALYGASGQSVDVIFKRSETLITTAPSPSSSIPSGWHASSADATGNGDLYACKGTQEIGSTTYTWDIPYKVEGADGSRGVSILSGTVDIAAETPDIAIASHQSSIAQSWLTAGGNNLTPTNVNGDQLVVTNVKDGNTWTHIFRYSGSAWVKSSVFKVDGNAIIDKTLSAGAIVSGQMILGGAGWEGEVPLDIKNSSGNSLLTVDQDKISINEGTLITGNNIIPSATSLTEAARKELNPHYLGTTPDSLKEVTGSVSTTQTLSTGTITTIGGLVNFKIRARARNSVEYIADYTAPVWTVKLYRGATVAGTLLETWTVTGTAANVSTREDTEPPSWIYSSSYNLDETVVYSDPGAGASQDYTVEVTKVSGTPTSIGLTITAESPSFSMNNIIKEGTDISVGTEYTWTDKETGFTVKQGRVEVPANGVKTFFYNTNFSEAWSAVATSDHNDWSEAATGSVTGATTGAITIGNHDGAVRAFRWIATGLINV